MKRLCDYWLKNFWGIGAILVCCLLLSSLLRIDSADAQQSPSAADCKIEQELDGIVQELNNRLNAFFATIMEGDTESAFQEIMRNSPAMQIGRIRDGIARMPNQVAMAKMESGNLCGWEKIETIQIGESVFEILYIAKHERIPLFWTFFFYRTPSTAPSIDPNTWVVTGMRFGTEL